MGHIRVLVNKVAENVGDLVIKVTPLTFEEFNNNGLTLPDDFINGKQLPDPAERK